MSFGKNMLLITTYWGNETTFKLMPTTRECPFMEVIYDPNTELLVVITTNMKENLQMVPRLDENGNQIASKRPKENGKPWAEKQIQLNVPQEFYLIEKEEQVSLIKELAINSESFDFEKFMVKKEQNLHVPEMSPLVDAGGAPLKAKSGGKKIIQMTPSTEG